MSITWNSSDKGANVTLSNGDLTAEANASNADSVRATNSKASGKWYWEVKIDVDADDHVVGIGTSGASITEVPGYDANGYGYNASMGEKGHNNSWELYGDSYTTNDIIGVALDLDNGKIWFAKNNVWQNSGNPAAGTNAAYTGLSGTFFPMHSPKDFPDPDPADKATARFDAGDQSYSPPSGFSVIGESAIFAEISDEVGLQDAFVLELPFWKDIADEVGLQDALSVETTYNLAFADAMSLDDALECEIYITMLTPQDAYHLQTADTPSIQYIITSPIGEVDLELPALEVLINSGAIANIELSIFEVDAVATSGGVARGNLNFPALSSKARTGLVAEVELPKLSVEGNALVGVVATGEVNLPLVELNASALLDILANLDLSLPSFRVSASSKSGATVVGDITLCPLHLVAKGVAGRLASGAFELPSLELEAELSHVPTGSVDATLPSLSLLAESVTLFDPSEGCSVLRHDRWR